MFKCFRILSVCVVVTLLSIQAQLSLAEDVKELKVGMIGLDTSHSIAFTKVLNDAAAADELSLIHI